MRLAKMGPWLDAGPEERAARQLSERRTPLVAARLDLATSRGTLAFTAVCSPFPIRFERNRSFVHWVELLESGDDTSMAA